MRRIGPSKIHPLHLGMVCVALALLAIITFAGCEALDNAATDANTVADATKTVLDSPAGQLAPPDIRLYGSLAISAVMAGAAGYKQWRLAQMGKTTKAIVRGIEAAELGIEGIRGLKAAEKALGNPKKLPVKTAIAAEMRRLGIYDAGNKIVERLKVS